MAPNDADLGLVLSLKSKSEKAHTGGVQVTMADGRSMFFSEDIDLELLRALTTIDGGETVGEF